jgi:predicted Fe-Mo cluster-binding NifX family protein
METKIAFPTDDGEAISRHFGQARYFKVITVTDGVLGTSELREKASHQHGEHNHTGGSHPGAQMVQGILDCQAVISGGMGTPMHDRLKTAGLKVVLTRTSSIAEAAKAYADGTLEEDPRLVHAHH